MRNLQALSQFIVPLVFLAVWALTSILNRENRPLPKRPGAAPPRPRPGFGPAAGPPTRESDPRTVERPVPVGTRIGTARPPGRTTDADVYVIDDEMVFVDPVTRRPIGSATIPPSRPGTRPSPRKPARNRRGESTASKPNRGANEPQRALSEQVGQSMAQNRGGALTNLAPLASSVTGLTGTSLRTASVAAVVTPNVAPPSMTAADVRRMMAEPARLREMAILAELLQPPVSRRGRRI